MLLSLVGLLCVLGYVAYYLTPDERARIIKVVVTFLEGDPRSDPFLGALRERTRWTLVTPALVALNAAMLLPMLWDPASAGNTDTLVGLGGNFGPRTTNGEWGRVLNAMFVHAGILQFIANAGALFQLGLVLERFVGPVAFLSVYFAAGIFANLTTISQDPLAIGIGASGAIFGIYGLLLTTCVWAVVDGSPLKISLMTLKRLAPAAAIFIVYNLATDHLSLGAEAAGLGVGIVGGAILSRGIGTSKPSLRRIAAIATAAIVLATTAAFTLRGIDDVRPELGRVIAVEDRIASTYDEAVKRFTKGRLRAEELALMIDKVIVPELHAADARLKAFDNVPHEYQPLVASAEEYFRLRHESWRLRASALRQMGQLVERKAGSTDPQAVTLALRQAERTERDSLESLKKIRPAQ